MRLILSFLMRLVSATIAPVVALVRFRREGAAAGAQAKTAQTPDDAIAVKSGAKAREPGSVLEAAVKERAQVKTHQAGDPAPDHGSEAHPKSGPGPEAKPSPVLQVQFVRKGRPRSKTAATTTTDRERKTRGSRTAETGNRENQRSAQADADRDRRSTRRPIPPEKRGGGRGQPATNAATRPGLDPEARQAALQTDRFRLRPSLRCRREGHGWRVELIVDRSAMSGERVEVTQGGQTLAASADDSVVSCYSLTSLEHELQVQGEIASKHVPLVERGEPLLFQLTGEANEGFRVHHVNRGHYLLIAPNTWRWENQDSPRRPLAAEPVVDCGAFVAHPFAVADATDGVPTLRQPDGTRWQARGRHVEVAVQTGEQTPLAYDDGSERGPLYLGEPLRLKAPLETWKEISTLILGEEGFGTGRRQWRVEVDPHQEVQSVPDHVRSRTGWLFVRLYDGEDELVDSFAFRWAPGIHRIRVEPDRTFPSAGDDEGAVAIIEHARSWRVTTQHRSGGAVPENRARARARTGADTTVTRIAIAAHPDADVMECKATGDDVELTFQILTSRAWWQLGHEEHPPADWRRTPCKAQLDDLKAGSRQALWVRCAAAKVRQGLRLGFTVEQSREPMRGPSQEFVYWPLREFGDERGDRERLRLFRRSGWGAEPESHCCVRISRPLRSPAPPPIERVAFQWERFIRHVLFEHRRQFGLALQRLYELSPPACRNHVARWTRELEHPKPDPQQICLALVALEELEEPLLGKTLQTSWLRQLPPLPETANRQLLPAQKWVRETWRSSLSS